jgi:FkbM family methyltransferase
MKYLHQLGQLLAVAIQPGGLHALLHRKPFSITAFHLLRRLRHQVPHLGTILDGGANVGQFARSATEEYPAASILAFEPLPEVAQRFRQHLAGCPQVRLFETALGATDGTLAFTLNAYSPASSALPLHTNHLERFPNARPNLQVTVPVARLDTLLAGIDLVPPVLLKLDLQGYERQALEGAPNTLQRVDFLLLETAFRPLYEGEALFGELYEFLRTRGFTFLRPLDVLPDATGEIIQMDALFARTA